MRKTMFLLLVLLGMTQLGAQEYEYVPFVREGVKWVYCYTNVGDDFRPADPSLAYGSVCLTLEIKGDTIINGKSYKAMHKYYGEAINEENDTIPIFLREERKIVYGIVPDGKTFPDCPIGNRFEGAYFFEKLYDGEEFILYDFNDPEAYWNAEANNEDNMDYYEPLSIDIISIGSNLAKKHVGRMGSQDFYQIEGIGVDASGSGYTLFPFRPMATGVDTYFQLCHVIEDGEIIYKSVNYKEPDPDGFEYVPFVREGVKWVYYYYNDLATEALDMPEGTQYYTFEMKGDVQIGDKLYKPVVLTHYYEENGQDKEVEDFVPIYLREEDKVVYAIHADGIQHPQCPVGIYQDISYPIHGLPITASAEEFVLYDFNDPKTFYDTFFEEDNYFLELAGYGPMVEYLKTDTILLGNRPSKCHHFNYLLSDVDKIIEGVGYDGNAGMPLFYFERFITGFQVYYYLSHVIEDGQIIYKGIHYNPDNHVGIDEAVVEQARRSMDDNYYNLMGQPVGKDVPTVPGIYIHQGKKILVR